MKKIKKALSVIIAILLLSLTFSVFGFAANSKAAIDIFSMSAAELQEAVDKGFINYETIMQLYLDRINAYNKQYGNVIINKNPTALEEARAKDEEFKKSGRRSDIFGLPVLVKDNIDVKGLPTTAGSIAMKDNYPNENSEAVQALLDAGAIVIAKTNMSFFAMTAYNSTSSYGNVYNAFNPDYSAYGSSSGSCVGVAARFAPLALGTDTNSSLRNPASANGVVAIRPTYGLISLDGVLPYDYYRDTVGPIAQNVSDCALLLGSLEGNSEKYSSSLKANGLQGKVIGIPKELYMQATWKNSNIPILQYENETVKNLMEQTIAKLEAEGATVILLEGVVNEDTNYLVQLGYTAGTFEVFFNEYIKGTTGTIRSFKQLADKSSLLNSYYEGKTVKDLTSGSYSNLLKSKAKYRNQVKEHVDGFFDKYGLDAIVYPTMQNTPLLSSNPYNGYYSNSYLMASTCGYPALSMPMGVDGNGNPVGLEILSKANNEKVVFEIAYSYEQAIDLNLKPSIVPSLYTVPADVESLKNVWLKEVPERQENGDASHYQKVLDAKAAIGSFFLNYSNEKTPETTSLELINNYTLAVKEYNDYLKQLETQKNIMIFLGIFLGAVVIATLFLVISAARKKKLRKRRASSMRRR